MRFTVPGRWSSVEVMLCCRYCKLKWCRPAGLATRPSWPVMARRRRCLGRCLPSPHSSVGGLVCLLAIFTPSFLLVAGALPFWERLRRNTRIQAALAGVNAAVVGLLLAALYKPVWTSAIHQLQDFVLAVVALLVLMVWKLPPWLVVAGCGVGGWLLSVVGA